MFPDNNIVTEEETGLQHLAAAETGGFILQSSQHGWKNESFPVGPLTMVLVENKLLVAGFKEPVDPDDPWARIEGREGGVLCLLSNLDGSKLAEYQLETLPVWNGMAAANEKIFISLKNGKLICMGGK